MSIKRTALDKLKTKFEGIDEKVLSRIATKIAKTAKTDEEVSTEVEYLTLMDVINSYTDSRVTDAQDKAVKRYKQENGIKDGEDGEDDGDGTQEGDGDGNKAKPEGNKGDDTDGKKGNGTGDDTPAYIKTLMKSVETLAGEVASLKAGKTENARKTMLADALKSASDKQRKFYERNFARMKFEDDEDFQDWLDEVADDLKDSTEGSEGNEGAEGNKPQPQPQGRPKGGGTGGGGIPALVQARIDARSKAVTAAPAIKGLPSNNA